MKKIKAIETKYKGYNFRSRLEARWAVFFDSLGIHWEYEMEGFELSSGQRYLPDFYLPYFNNGIYVEVKPTKHYDDKAETFALESGVPVLMAVGCPDLDIYKMFLVDKNSGNITSWDCIFRWKYIGGINKIENRLYWNVDYSDIDLIEDQIVEAINKAKSERF